MNWQELKTINKEVKRDHMPREMNECIEVKGITPDTEREEISLEESKVTEMKEDLIDIPENLPREESGHLMVDLQEIDRIEKVQDEMIEMKI